MNYVVILSKSAEKDIRRVPKHILILLDLWIEIINDAGYLYMQSIKGYRDHSLKGKRKNQRSVSLTRSWRVIYKIDKELNILTIEILEVNHHDY